MTTELSGLIRNSDCNTTYMPQEIRVTSYQTFSQQVQKEVSLAQRTFTQ